MFTDYDILVDSDLKNLASRVKRKLKTWTPISEITVIQNPSKFNEFALQLGELDPATAIISPFLDYDILIDNDINNLKHQVKRLMAYNWFPVGDLLVIPSHQGYNTFAIQVAELSNTNMAQLFGP